MHEVLVNRLEGLSLPRKSVVRLTDRPDMTLDVYRGRKTTMQCNYYNYYSSNYDSSHKSWIIASTAVVILHIIYGVSLQTFFYHYLTYCNYCCNRCKKKKKNSIIHPSNLSIIALSEHNDDFFLFPPNKESKGLPSIFLSVTAAQGYSQLSRFHQCTPEKNPFCWHTIAG